MRSRSSTYQIGDVSERTGLSLRTVRYYEEAGLIRPIGRTPGGFRLYDDDCLDRFEIIKHMKPLGFTLDEMRSVLDTLEALDDPSLANAARSALSERLALFTSAAQTRCDALAEDLAVAESFVRRLSRDLARHRSRG